MIVDGTKPGSSTPCSARPEGSELRPCRRRESPGRNGIVVCKANDASASRTSRCAISSAGPASRERDLVERRRRIRQDRVDGLLGHLPQRHLHLLQRRGQRPPTTASSLNAGGAGQMEPYLRVEHERLGHVRRVPATSVRRHHRPRLDGVQRARLLGDQLRRDVVIQNSQFDHNQDGLDTNTQIAGDPPPPQDGGLPGRQAPAPSPRPTPAGSSTTTTCTTTTTATSPSRATRRRADRHRHDALRRAQGHCHGQHLHQQRRVGHPVRALSRQRHSVAASEVRRLRRVPRSAGSGCVFEPQGNALMGNTFVNDGYFGNPSNADFGQILLHSGSP